MRSRANRPQVSMNSGRYTGGGGDMYPSGHSGGGGGGGGDGFSYTTYERSPGVGAKVGCSLTKLFFGPFLIFFGCMLLFYNEGWAVKTHRSLNEALDNYVPIRDPSKIDSSLDDKLVYLTEKVEVDVAAIDPDFGLQRDNALSVSRNVEIYQWVEIHKKERRKLSNGETEVRHIYNYQKKWVKNPVDSGNFQRIDGHENYGQLPFRTETFTADGVRLGVYFLSNALTRQISSRSSVPASEAKKIPAGAELAGNDIYFLTDAGTTGQITQGGGSIAGDPNDAIDKTIVEVDGEDKIMYRVKATGKLFSVKEKALRAAAQSTTVSSQSENQVRRNTGENKVGDVRVSFTEVRCTIASVLARVKGEILSMWPSKQGPGYDIGILVSGNRSAEDMISGAQTTNNIMCWVKRAGGYILNLIGFSMITQIISTAGDITLNWIPFLGPMSMSIINLGVTIANLILATVVSLPVAAVAWIYYRPLLGASMLIGSMGLFYTASQAGGRVNKGHKVG